MNYMLKFSGYVLVMLVVLSTMSTSCRKEPNFDNIPQIEFRRFEMTEGKDVLNEKTRNFSTVLYFQDGDGNLGLSPLIAADSLPPFQLNGDYYYNFHMRMLVKETAPDGSEIFVPFEFPTEDFTFNGRFPRVSSDAREEPLEGELKFTQIFQIDLWELIRGKTAKFEIFIYDRNRPVPNKSNVIITPEYTFTP